MNIFATLSLCLVLAGCAGFAIDDDFHSIKEAGITTFHSEPVIVGDDDKYIGTEYTLLAGKEYETLAITLDWSEGDNPRPIVTVTAMGVGAFAGQMAAAQTVVAVQEALTELGVELGENLPAVTEAIIRTLVPATGLSPR